MVILQFLSYYVDSEFYDRKEVLHVFRSGREAVEWASNQELDIRHRNLSKSFYDRLEHIRFRVYHAVWNQEGKATKSTKFWDSGLLTLISRDGY